MFQKFFGRNTDIDMTCRNRISHKQMDQKFISEKNVKFPYKAKTMQVHIIAVIVVKCLYNLVIVRFWLLFYFLFFHFPSEIYQLKPQNKDKIYKDQWITHIKRSKRRRILLKYNGIEMMIGKLTFIIIKFLADLWTTKKQRPMELNSLILEISRLNVKVK